MKHIMKFGAVALCIFLSACSTNIKRSETANQGAVPTITKYRDVSITFSPEGKKKAGENLQFNADTLRSTVKRAMEAQDLLQANHATAPNVEITVTDIRVRSGIAAVMFGFMAGSDSVVGDVQVKDATGATWKKFEVSASYALGGLAGGQNDARLGWLYEKFAEQTVNELMNKP